MWYPLQQTNVLAVLMGLMALAATGCAGNEECSPKELGGIAAATSSSGHEAQLGAVANQIVIDNFAFKPSELTISAGTKVTWINRDDVPHTATSTARPKRFDSGTLDTDGQFAHVFREPGTYDYFCAVHPKMTGRILVK